MTVGDHICTFGILFDFNSEASVVAKTYCEVLMLIKEDLDKVLAHHPFLVQYVVADSWCFSLSSIVHSRKRSAKNALTLQ